MCKETHHPVQITLTIILCAFFGCWVLSLYQDFFTFKATESSVWLPIQIAAYSLIRKFLFQEDCCEEQTWFMELAASFSANTQGTMLHAFERLSETAQIKQVCMKLFLTNLTIRVLLNRKVSFSMAIQELMDLLSYVWAGKISIQQNFFVI